MRHRDAPGHARGQVTTREYEGLDTTLHESGELRVTVADPRVLRDDGPSLPPGFGQPLLVGRVRAEVGVVGVDFDPLRPQLGSDDDVAERTV